MSNAADRKWVGLSSMKVTGDQKENRIIRVVELKISWVMIKINRDRRI